MTSWLLFALLALAVGMMGCATPQQKAERTAWQVICEQAPHGAGQEIGAREQRAMTTVGAWKLSVEALDARCGY